MTFYLFMPHCPYCGRNDDIMSMPDIHIGPEEGDGAVCWNCSAIIQYDHDLNFIPADDEADRRWKKDEPSVHGCLHAMSRMAREDLRVIDEVNNALQRLTPGAGENGNRQ